MKGGDRDSFIGATELTMEKSSFKLLSTASRQGFQPRHGELIDSDHFMNGIHDGFRKHFCKKEINPTAIAWVETVR